MMPQMSSVIPGALQRRATPTTFLVTPDEKMIPALLDRLLDTAGLSQSEAARRLGEGRQNISNLRHGRRRHLTLEWLARFVAVCGGKILVELPVAL